ncbi:MAG: hypothetical protein HC915_08115 [Anaerolineae bacterium]|nr:hypothetical protein [Anaerolineae bacterium]
MREWKSLARRAGVWALLLGGGLVGYSVALTALAGDIGFWGDDWWILGYGYRLDWLRGVYHYTFNERRPTEGAYAILIFELLGANRVAYFLLSQLWNAAASLLLGLVIWRAFPARPRWAAASALFAFWMPMTAETTYAMHMDNGRIQMVLFWATVLLFQVWAVRWRTWIGLVLPLGFYYTATQAYESAPLLIALVPFFVLPVWLRQVEPVAPVARLKAALQLSLACMVGLAAFFVHALSHPGRGAYSGGHRHPNSG